MSKSGDLRHALWDKFRAVGRERLEKLAGALLRLEEKPDERALALEAQREIHTLKGEARILGLEHTNRTAHLVEDLLHRAQASQFADRQLTDLILSGFELLGQLVGGVSENGEPQALLPEVEQYIRLASPLLQAEPEAQPQDSEQSVARAITPSEGNGLPPATPASSPAAGATSLPVSSLRVDLRKIEQLTHIVSDLQAGQAKETQIWERTSELAHALEVAFRQLRRGMEQQTAGDGLLEATLADLDEAQSAAKKLLRLAREWLHDGKANLERLSTTVRTLRMVPLASLYERFLLPARKLAVELGKEVRLVTSGADIEVDGRVLDELDAPLLHLLRNAVDHGIEPKEERLALGKPALAVLRIDARLNGARVEITVADDGRGIDAERVREVAAERRILSREAAQAASDRDILELLFTPGFSTRAQVSDVSGRGIGLDVVKHRVEALGGAVRIDSQPGRGTLFCLTVPPSVALSRALVVDSGGARYALPADNVVNVAAPLPSEIEHAAGGELLRHEGVPILIHDLAEILEGREGAIAAGTRPVVLLEHAERVHGFWVDKLIGDRQVLFKPVGSFFDDATLVRGAAILENGELVVTLDVQALLASAATFMRRQGSRPDAKREDDDKPSVVLVVEDSELTRDLLVGILRDQGHRVLEAVNGEAALELLAKERPDLILTDLQMPVLDGFSLLRQLRADPRWQNLPVVVCSTIDNEADKREASLLGADAYLVKSDMKKENVLATVGRFVGIGRQLPS